MFTSMDAVPEALLQRIVAYNTAAPFLTVGRHDWRIPSIVAEQWLTKGYAVLSTNGLALQFGSTRRTMCMAIKRVVAAGLIEEIGRTPDGRPMYAPCLHKGAQWRAANAERHHAAA